MEIGIVGLPNVGKSTTFNVLTKARGAQVANYEFCTIEPNVGIVTVPDKRLDFLYSVYNDGKTSYVPATIKFVDIAGLVAGASKGEGLGNKFLAHIKEVDAIAQVVRCFSDPNVARSAGKVNPVADIEVINTELMLADMESVANSLEKVAKKAKGGDKDSIRRVDILTRAKAALDSGRFVSTVDYSHEDMPFIREYMLLTMKPVLYVFNTDEDKIQDFEKQFPELIEYIKKQKSEYVVISAKIESEMAELSEEEKKDFIKELGFDYKGFDEFIRHSYHLLDLITFLTAGVQEVRAWPIRRNTKAEDAAGKIHSDIQRGFIKAEIMKFDDFAQVKDEVKMKEQGKMRSEGREYIMQDGDIVYFKFNV